MASLNKNPYKWNKDKDDNTYSIYDVEIFGEIDINRDVPKRDKKGNLVKKDGKPVLERKKLSFGADYITSMQENMVKRAKSNYYPPCHTKHKEKDKEGRLVWTNRFAGHMSNAHLKEIDKRKVISVDIHNIPEEQFNEIKNKKWAYRSIEINDPKKKEISSLALLDVEPPQLKFPILEVTKDPKGKETFSNKPANTYRFNDNYELQDSNYEETDAVSLMFSESFNLNEEEEEPKKPKKQNKTKKKEGKMSEDKKTEDVETEDVEEKVEMGSDGKKKDASYFSEDLTTKMAAPPQEEEYEEEVEEEPLGEEPLAEEAPIEEAPVEQPPVDNGANLETMAAELKAMNLLLQGILNIFAGGTGQGVQGEQQEPAQPMPMQMAESPFAQAMAQAIIMAANSDEETEYFDEQENEIEGEEMGNTNMAEQANRSYLFGEISREIDSMEPEAQIDEDTGIAIMRDVKPAFHAIKTFCYDNGISAEHTLALCEEVAQYIGFEQLPPDSTIVPEADLTKMRNEKTLKSIPGKYKDIDFILDYKRIWEDDHMRKMNFSNKEDVKTFEQYVNNFQEEHNSMVSNTDEMLEVTNFAEQSE